MDERLVSAAEDALRRAEMLSETATVLVALSGGADSVALLLAMLELKEKYGLAVYAVHVEHGLRGEESLADAAFCEALCGRLHVPFACDHANLRGGMDDAGAEAAAREARYTLLLARAKTCGADALLLAHHQDDQAETVLQRLLRGSGARGLSGMEETAVRDGVTLIRPFLSLPKQVLINALEGTDYRIDESNLSPVCQRNRIRLAIMPKLIEENPAAIAHIAQSAALLRLDEACLQKQADAILQNALIDKPPYFCLHREAVQDTDAAVALRALRSFAELGMQKSGDAPDEFSLSADDSLKLLTLLSASESSVCNLPGALHATATRRFIHLTRMEGDAPLTDVPLLPPQPLETELSSLPFGEIALHMMPHAPGGVCPDGKRTVVLTRSLIKTAVMRQPRPGDVIRPFGAEGQKPLRRYLIDKKLDQPFRRHLPVVAVGKDVLWAVGVGAAESTRMMHEPSILFTLQGALPWCETKHKRSTP
ncbi:MAG: tRNA lysidine(34) synthetase TilS [Clostridiales bacterium]|nr:tRNA lysidine(34) synthetase TilS [Clostridiales bacterium]